MPSVINRKHCFCHQCNTDIYSNDLKSSKRGRKYLCEKCTRVKVFHRQSIQWIKSNFKQVMQIDNGMPLTARVINGIYKRLER